MIEHIQSNGSDMVLKFKILDKYNEIIEFINKKYNKDYKESDIMNITHGEICANFFILFVFMNSELFNYKFSKFTQI
jgi:hypothetical protein